MPICLMSILSSNTTRGLAAALAIVCPTLLPLLAGAADIAAREASVAANPLKEAYFGETHVHTSYSLDAYIGGARLTPDDAYRFAKGETITVNGQQHNIIKPLDFAAVTDHAEFLAEMFAAQVAGAPGLRSAPTPGIASLKRL